MTKPADIVQAYINHRTGDLYADVGKLNLRVVASGLDTAVRSDDDETITGNWNFTSFTTSSGVTISGVPIDIRTPSTVEDVESSGSTGNGSFTSTFTSGNETDPDGWKQGDDQTYTVPVGKAGHYIINMSMRTTGHSSGDRITASINVGGSDLASDTNVTEGTGDRNVSVSIGVTLLEGQDVLFKGFSTANRNISFRRISISQII